MSNYTFNPPEEELINNYLNNKITGNADSKTMKLITEINICHYEPIDLPGFASIQSSHDTWYFISPVETFGKKNRRKRKSRTGHWKITGKDRTITDLNLKPIGLKKFLVFKENKSVTSPCSSFTWKIHEFHSFLDHPNKDAFVLCKLTRKTSKRPVATTATTTGTSNAFPMAIDTPLNVTSDTTLVSYETQTQTQNTIFADDYGANFLNNLEEHFSDFETQLEHLLQETSDYIPDIYGPR